MAITNSIENFKMEVNEGFVKKAQALKPQIYQYQAKPVHLVRFEKGQLDYDITARVPAEEAAGIPLGKSDSICFDFGNHYVGYLSFRIKAVGSPPDAPAHIRIKLGEHICEIAEESSAYQGSISSSWIQEEFLHVDVLPAEILMPRRYAFRYLEIKVMDTSPKYKIIIEEVSCRAVTSGDISKVLPLSCQDKELRRIDEIALRTMENCMQDVFEDGPKRDRRLWIGDLRLQALTSYETFKNYELVKRCLYLFAGLTQNEGQVGACLFTEPELLVDDTALFDYSLFFISCLYDYYHATQEKDVLIELWEMAFHQIELAERAVDERGVVRDQATWWCFIDWQDQLNKQAPAQAVLIYALKQAVVLADILEDKERKDKIERLMEKVVDGAKKYLWDSGQQFFVSGEQRQVSWASQIWFVLAGIFTREENQKLLKHLAEADPPVGMVTPYMNHHYIDALIQSDMIEEAKAHIKYYWGGMVKQGADCFWELFDPQNIYVSPYGSRVINSYCHAWSCTPAYMIRKYFADEKEKSVS